VIDWHPISEHREQLQTVSELEQWTDVDPVVRDECVRVARRIVGAKVVGLLPASNDIGVPGVGVQLGLALAEVSLGTVAFVDANLRWPAILSAEVANAEPFATRWLRGSLALLTPQRIQAAGAGVPQLRQLLASGSELFAHVLVDLTGFKKLGEHLAAMQLVDGVVIVARVGRTTEGELLRLGHELPASRNLGVMLTGAA